MQNEKINSVESLKHLPEYANSAIRCDLHPKWSHDGMYICIDTLDRGYRSIFLYEY